MQNLKKLSSFPILILSCFSTLAQEYTLTGMVKDYSQIIAFANVILTDSNGKIITGAVTEENGRFSLTAQKGNYVLTVSFLGYQTWEQTISANQNLDLGVIVLKSQDNELDEVIVTAEKPLIEQKVDRLVFNVENSITAIGGNAIDALRVTPGVRANNEELSVIGKDNVKIMINGKLLQFSGSQAFDYLKSIPTKDIKSVELITNPPARYSAEGNSGLINIKLKSYIYDHYKGSFTSTAVQTTYLFGSISGNMSYKKNKLSISSSLKYGNGATKSVETSSFYYPIQIWKSDNKRKDYNKLFNGRIGIGYDISKIAAIGMQYMGGTNFPNMKEHGTTKILDYENMLDSTLVTNAYNDRKNYYHIISANYKRRLDTLGKTLYLGSDYLLFNSSQDRDFTTGNYDSNGIPTNSSFYSSTNKSNQDIKSYTINVDIELPYKFADIETGAKLSFIKNNSAVLFYEGKELVSSSSDTFKYDENTQTIYLSARRTIGEKWTLKAGLRVENTLTKGVSATLDSVNKNNYTKLFPTFYLTYQAGENNKISFNYGKRISRPGYWRLNPFRWYFNPYNYSEGNPFLKPSYTDNMELSFLFNRKHVISIYYSKMNNGYGQVTVVNQDSNIQSTEVKNYYDSDKLGLTQSYNSKINEVWESHNQLYVYYSHINSKILLTKPNLDGWGAYISTRNTFVIFNKKKTILGEINYWYQFPEVTGLSRSNGYSQLDLGIKFILDNNNLHIGINGIDILSSNRPKYTTYTNSIKQEFENYYDQRQLRFTLTYFFGNKKIKANKIKTGNNDEIKRVN